MKILSPNEFKIQNPDAYLGDYLTYLENEQKKAEETLQYAKTLLSDASIIADIQKQAEEIFQMAMLVEEYMGQIVLKSVSTLPPEVLPTYFNFDEENRLAKEKKAQLEEMKKSLKERLEEIEKQIANNLYLNGRCKEFYEVEDVSIFFSATKSSSEFVGELLSSPILSESFKDDLNAAVERELSNQNISMEPNDKSELVSKLIGLIIDCRQILAYSPNAIDQLIEIILSGSKIKTELPSSLDENTCIYIIQGLQNLPKFRTAFYASLPTDLQTKLSVERLQGETYKILNQTYQAFLNGEELPSNDLSEEELEEKKEIERKIEKINYDIVSLDAKEESQKEFLTNVEEMRAVLREMILEMLQGQISAKDIDSIIKEAENKTEKLKADLLEASSSLSAATSDLERAQAILLDADYHIFFQLVERNNVRRLYKAFGVNVTEEVILPFLEEEKRRYEQIDIMVTLQNTLSTIHSSKKEKDKKSNFITRNLPAYKESLKQLDDQYKKTIEEAFQALKKKKLFYINAPRISDDSTVGNVIILPPTDRQPEPTNFSEVNGLKQSFWNMSTGIDENTKKRFLATNQEMDWETYYQNLMQTQSELITKLLSFEAGEDGYYTFASTPEEREELKKLQLTIIGILSSIYDERKAFRESLGDFQAGLEPKKVAELEHFLGHGANLSRENLAAYIDQTQSKIGELKTLLSNNRALCLKLGIALPKDITITEGTSEEDNNDLENKIQSLGIEGVTNLEEAIAYRNLLLGLEEYTVPPAKVKQFCLEHKKN